MQLEILQENLNRALSQVSRIIASRPQIPILANVLLSAKDGQVTLTTSNLETSVVVSVGAKITTPGDFTVPGRTFTEIIASLSAEKVALEVKEGSLLIKAGGFHARINGVAAAEYPVLSEKAALAENNYWEVSKLDLLDALEKTTYAAASDEGRAVLTGVLLKPEEKGLTLASTDGFRLSVVHLIKAVGAKKESFQAVVIPARSLSELVRLLSEQGSVKKEETLKIFISSTDNQVYFDLDSVKIFSRLITGSFPDYEKIIPSKSLIKITTTAEELTKAVKLASIFARDSANIVKLRIEKESLTISANASQVGENESVVDAAITGEAKSEDFAIAFNYRYLLDFLASLTGEITMEFSGPVASGVFRATASPTFLHIIMPVRVQN